jgi:hypothetical protein
MKKRRRGKYIIDLKEIWDFVWRFTLSLILVVIFILIFVYPERAMIKEYREKLTNSHCITRGYINDITHRDNTIYYEFVVDGIKYSGISRYCLLDQPYPQEGDSIDVYYDEKDPNINLWSGEFYE